MSVSCKVLELNQKLKISVKINESKLLSVRLFSFFNPDCAVMFFNPGCNIGKILPTQFLINVANNIKNWCITVQQGYSIFLCNNMVATFISTIAREK